MSGEELSAEQKIVLAAIECIERQGIHKVTIRSIAREAGVNSAAINYYFRSKEKLVAKAMATTLGHLAEDLRAIAGDRTRPLADRLRDLLEYFDRGAIRYPRVTRAHLYEPFLEGSSESQFGKLIAEILALLNADLERRQGRRIASSGWSSSFRLRCCRLSCRPSSEASPASTSGTYEPGGAISSSW